MPSSFATLAIGRDVSITIFTASSLNSGEKLFFGRGKTSPFQIVHLIGWTVRKARGTSVVHRGIQCDLHYGVLVLLGTGKGGRCRCLRAVLRSNRPTSSRRRRGGSGRRWRGRRCGSSWRPR